MLTGWGPGQRDNGSGFGAQDFSFLNGYGEWDDAWADQYGNLYVAETSAIPQDGDGDLVFGT